MSRDSDLAGPYQHETDQNTHAPWLAGTDGTKVDVDISGLRAYAGKMSDAASDLAGRSAHLTHLMSMPQDAWSGATLGEAAFVRSQLMANASELTTYLSVLRQTLMNIGSAAQTVADIYHTADGTSAADLNDVLFAFGDPTVRRPAGLPRSIGQTYDQAVASDNAATATPGSSGLWGPPTRSAPNQFETVETSVGPGGQIRTVTTSTSPEGGSVLVTTVVTGANGKVLSRSSTQTTSSFDSSTNTNTKTVTSYTGDQVTGTTRTATTYGKDGTVTAETTTQTAADGKPTGTRSTTVDPTTHETTEVTTSVDDKGQSHETDHVVIGEATPGGQSVPDPLSTQYDPTLNRAH